MNNPNSSISGSHVSTSVLASKHHQISAFANKGSYSNKALKKARSKAAVKERVVEPVVSDKSHREDQLVKRFLANVRTLRNYKPVNDKQHLQRSLIVAQAAQQVYFFLTQNYFRDTNTDLDVYKAIVDKNYVKEYMSRIVINDRVRELYFAPRKIEIIYNTATLNVEAVFNGKEYVDLMYGSISSSSSMDTMYSIAKIRSNIEKEYNALVFENATTVNVRTMEDMCVAHIALNIVNEPKVAIAQWIIDTNSPLTVEDFIYVYTTPHCLRTLVKDGIGAIDLDANPNRYDPVEHGRLRKESDSHVFDEDVKISFD